MARLYLATIDELLKKYTIQSNENWIEKYMNLESGLQKLGNIRRRRILKVWNMQIIWEKQLKILQNSSINIEEMWSNYEFDSLHKKKLFFCDISRTFGCEKWWNTWIFNVKIV